MLPVKFRRIPWYLGEPKLRRGGVTAFLFDCWCFFGTIFSVLRGDGVVEGGTGKMHTSPIAPNDGKTLYTEDDYQFGDEK